MYLKIAFSEASVHAIHFYPEVRAFYQKMRRRSNVAIARTVVAKELARVVYHMLKDKVKYRGFKGQPIQRNKALAWPRRARFAPVSAVARS
jgi:transposase